MDKSTLILCFLTFIHIAQSLDNSALKNGPCPVKIPIQDFKPKSFAGIWYDLYTQDASELSRRCIHNQVNVTRDDRFYIISRYTNSSGVQTDYKKSIPASKLPGLYTVYGRESDGEWSTKGWKYTFLADLSNGYTYLEFACQEIGSQHWEYFEIRSRSNKISKQELKALKEIAIANGSTNEFLKLKHSKCNYDLH